MCSRVTERPARLVERLMTCSRENWKRNRRSLHYATPDFPVEVGGVGELHAAFLTESRTRGRWRVQRNRESGYAPVQDDGSVGEVTERRSLRGSRGAQQVPPLRYPGFPVEVGGVGKIHAASCTGSRIRGCWWFRDVGNPGPLRSG
jgi:hypothetical protein